MKIMPNVFEYDDHRKFLADRIEEMRRTRRGFSLRWLAQKCAFSTHTFLPRVLRGDRNLTLDSAGRVAQAIGLKGPIAKAFLALVEQEIEPTEEGRTRAAQDFASLQAVHRRHRLVARQARYYAKWYYPVVRQLAIWADWNGDWERLAAMLDPPIEPQEAREAIETLLELGLLARDEDGAYHSASPTLNVDRLPAHSKRMGREDILKRGIASLSHHSVQERHTICVLLAMSESSYQQAIEILGEASQRCLGLATSDPKVDRVWQMAIQIFPASKRLEATP